MAKPTDNSGANAFPSKPTKQVDSTAQPASASTYLFSESSRGSVGYPKFPEGLVPQDESEDEPSALKNGKKKDRRETMNLIRDAHAQLGLANQSNLQLQADMDNVQGQLRAALAQIAELNAAAQAPAPVSADVTALVQAIGQNLQRPAGGQPRLSAKVADPELLDDGVSPTYQQWKSGLDWKLNDNIDHFQGERSRIMYAYSRTTGVASSILTPKVAGEDGMVYQVLDQLLQDLDDNFLDPYVQQRSENELFKLQMRDKEEFRIFHIKFAELANKAKAPMGTRVNTMHRKLPSWLRNKLENSFRQNANAAGYTAYVKDALYHDNYRTQNKSDEEHRQAMMGNAKPDSKDNVRLLRDGKKPVPLQTFNPRPNFTGLTFPAVAVKKELGDKAVTCYNCCKPGHYARDCTEPHQAISNILAQLVGVMQQYDPDTTEDDLVVNQVTNEDGVSENEST